MGVEVRGIDPVWPMRIVAWSFLAINFYTGHWIYYVGATCVAVLWVMMHYDVIGFNLLFRGMYPRAVVPPEDRTVVGKNAYFITFSINSDWFPNSGIGKIRLTDTHFTLAYVTGLPSSALVHEPLGNIERVALRKTFLGAKSLHIDFSQDAAVRFVNLWLGNSGIDEWWCNFDSKGIRTEIDTTIDPD